MHQFLCANLFLIYLFPNWPSVEDVELLQGKSELNFPKPPEPNTGSEWSRVEAQWVTVEQRETAFLIYTFQGKET